jgi:hypothetical protein
VFTVLSVCGFLLCDSYPYRIEYIQEANLGKIQITTLAFLLAGTFCGANVLRISSRKSLLSGGLWIGISWIGLAAMFADPRQAVKSVLTAQNICINHQRSIERAKADWAQRVGAANGAKVSWDDLTAYFTNGIPKCPEGGSYILGSLGEPVLCSATNHLRPPQFR